jgi:hypothetical protein
MMQEHRWQSRGARPINVKESVQELNTGQLQQIFEIRLNSVPEFIF